MLFKKIKTAYKVLVEPEKYDVISKDTGESIVALGYEKATFFGEGTVEEFREQEERDKGFVKRVFGL